MKPFRSEIRNSPRAQTIKVFLSDESLDSKIKSHLEHFEEIELIEIRESIGRNRADENITIFLKEGADINKVKESIDSSLWWYFEEDMVDE
jgi:TusA-related sulfurtransferase